MKNTYILLLLFFVSLINIKSDAQPNSFSTTVTTLHGDFELVLYKYNSRGENYQVFTYDGEVLTPYEAPESRTYRGYIKNMENSHVVASWYPNDKLYCRVLFGKGWRTGFTLDDIDISTLAIKELDLPIVSIPQKSKLHLTSGYTTIHEWFLETAGGDIDQAIAIFDNAICQFDYVTVRDLGMSTEINLLVIPTDPKVDKVNWFRPKQSNYPDLNETRLFYKCYGSGGGAGGTNFCGGFYSGGRTGIQLGGAAALTHEFGHNLGLPHYSNQTDAMWGNGYFFGRNNAIKVANKLEVNGADCLAVSDPNYTDPVHPYTPEDYFISKSNQPAILDVLANDVDYNGDKITIKNFDEKSKFGGSIKQEGQKLTYIPPKNFVGRDYFYYRAHSGDRDSKTYFWNDGKVMIDVRKENGLALHYKFEEKIGPMVYDQGWKISSHHGSLNKAIMSKNSVPGVLGKGIHLTDNQFIRLDNVLDPLDESLSVSLWFNIDKEIPNGKEMTLFGTGSKMDMKHAGISVGITKEKIHFFAQHEGMNQSGADRYQEVNWDPGKWYHVVLVVDRKQNKLFGYLNGKELGQSQYRQELNTKHGTLKGQPGSMVIGVGRGIEEDFSLAVDEFKIFTKALTIDEIEDEYNNPSGDDFECPKGLFHEPVKNAGFDIQQIKLRRERQDIRNGWYVTSINRCKILWSGFSSDIPDAPEKDNWASLKGDDAAIYQQIGTWKANDEIKVNFFYGRRQSLNCSDLEVSLWFGANTYPENQKHLSAIGAKKVASKIISKTELDNQATVEKEILFKLNSDQYDCEPIWIMFENKNAGKRDINLIDKILIKNGQLDQINNNDAKDLSIQVYPNPTNDLLYVNTSNSLINKMNITISDQLGRKMRYYQLGDQGTLNLSDLAPGIYFFNIETNKGNIVKKVVKS